jgi:hypothetical protein
VPASTLYTLRQLLRGFSSPPWVKNAIRDMMKWCRITAIDLSYANIKADGVGRRLAAVLGQCASLAHLDLGGNKIGAEGAGGLRRC